MRATLAHVEAALEGREAELHDSWHALRQQAEELQSHAELTPEMLQPDASARVGSPPQLPPIALPYGCVAPHAVLLIGFVQQHVHLLLDPAAVNGLS